MIFLLIGLGCLLVGAIGFIYGCCVLNDNTLKLKAQPINPKAAVLIPARFECAVIEGLFKSLKKQTVKIPPKHIYVIVESLQDPTVKIAKKYGHKVIVRDNVKGRERKGYALDEALRQILACQRYDLYFIFDADNILAPDYIERMFESYAAGFEIVTGYRNIKNKKPNVVAAASCLVFSLLNSLGNHMRVQRSANVIFSGTGCFVDGKLVDEWQGWPFHSLTEDYELSLYATLNQLATFYNEQAVFYDEQPTELKQTFDQRIRWIRGYFDARKIYVSKMRQKLLDSRKAKKSSDNCTNVLIQQYGKNPHFGSIKREILGIKPVIWLVVGIVLVMIYSLLRIFRVESGWVGILSLGLIILAIYVVLLILTWALLKREKLNLSRGIKIKVLFYNPCFLITFVPCALKAILMKKVDWVKIDHKEV